jgi:hypothetical protein
VSNNFSERIHSCSLLKKARAQFIAANRRWQNHFADGELIEQTGLTEGQSFAESA